MSNSYKGIEFAKGYNRPFADFQKEFERCQVFRNMHPKERLKALKEAHKIAIQKEPKTKQEIDDIEVNGDTNPTVPKSSKTNSRKDS
jgi:hypothetical protein